MTDARNILDCADPTPVLSDCAVQVASRRPLEAAIRTLKRMRSGRTVMCVARRVQSVRGYALAGKATRRYQACSAAGLGVGPLSLLSVRA